METQDLARVREILYSDKVWAVYALADLQDPQFRPHCRWHISKPSEEEAVVLIFSAFDLPVIIAVGAEATVERILAKIEPPSQIFAMVQENHHLLLEKYYTFAQGIDPMMRMVLSAEAGGQANNIGATKASATKASATKADRLRRLNVEDEAQVRGLFSHGGPHAPGSFFSRYQMEQGAFYGLYNKYNNKEGELLAVGGTHVVDKIHSVAAIGNMYTHPEQRKKGYATTILKAIIADLKVATIDTIVLNVDQRNHTARKIYEQCGFQAHCNYIEGVGTLLK